MASMLTTASFSMKAPGQASDDLVTDQTYGSTLTCTLPILPNFFSHEQPKRKGPAIPAELFCNASESKGKRTSLLSKS